MRNVLFARSGGHLRSLQTAAGQSHDPGRATGPSSKRSRRGVATQPAARTPSAPPPESQARPHQRPPRPAHHFVRPRAAAAGQGVRATRLDAQFPADGVPAAIECRSPRRRRPRQPERVVERAESDARTASIAGRHSARTVADRVREVAVDPHPCVSRFGPSWGVHSEPPQTDAAFVDLLYARYADRK